MENPRPSLSIIIPTYNEAEMIQQHLNHLISLNLADEIIVVDGNSIDDTVSIVSDFDQVRLIQSVQRGRSIQMISAAKAAKGDLIFFLHADTSLPSTARKDIHQVFANSEIQAASFSLSFDVEHPFYKVMSWFSRINSALTTYGDQGLIIRKDFYHQIGGFKEWPILEDLEIQYRIRKYGTFIKMNTSVLSSARRFETQGKYKQLFIDCLIVMAWKMGCSPFKLKKYYSYKPKQ
ncbi:MAG: TIGR04283 family arsenosugar biosynthesis glycosyltransferase [Bacteroidota bacterium]